MPAFPNLDQEDSLMSKKLLTIGAAMVLVLAVAFVAISDAGDAAACKDKDGAKASTASKSSSCSAKAATASAKTAGACARSAAAASGCCASGKAAVAGYTKGDCANKASANAAALAEITDEVPYGERKRIVVAGTMACGNCTYQKTAGCAPLIKTGDGKVYPLVNNEMVKRMREAEAEEGFELSARVRKLEDGMKYLEVVSFKAL